MTTQKACVVCHRAEALNNPYPLTKVEGKALHRGDSVCSLCGGGVVQLRRYYMDNGITSKQGDYYGPATRLDSDGTLSYVDQRGKRIILPFVIWCPED